MTAPAWSRGDLLEVCQPDLHVACEWPDCAAGARYEVELAVDGRWCAKRVCQAHYERLTAQ